MPVRVLAEKVETYHLKPGDLYTLDTTEQVQVYLDKEHVGLPLLMRTNAESDDPRDEYVYRITIEKIDEEGQLQQAATMDPFAPPGVKSWK